jgi:hypothetical protein
MTITEALSAICSEQGFLVLNSKDVYATGQIVGKNASLYVKRTDGTTWHEDVNQPVQVVGPASREDFMRQVERLDLLLGTRTNGWEIAHPYLYRVITD